MIAADEIVKHLRQCEEALLEEGIRRDRAQVSALLSEDFVEFGASGRKWTRDEILVLLENEYYKQATIVDFRCTLLAENVALVTYLAEWNGIPEGIGSSLRSSVWIKQNDVWRLRFHQGTRTENARTGDQTS